MKIILITEILIVMTWAFPWTLQAQTQQAAPATGSGRHHHHGQHKMPEVQVTTLAGSGSLGALDGNGTDASFSGPSAIAVDKYGNLFVADTGNNLIREVNPGGAVTTLAGSAGVTGATDAAGVGASFNDPRGIAVDAAGVLYVADTGNSAIRKISPDGKVTTLKISLPAAAGPATGAVALLDHPQGLALDPSGDLLVADTGHNRVCRVTPAGVLMTLAGSAGVTGATDAVGAAASFDRPQALALDAQGNVYVADTGNRVVRKIAPDGTVTTLVSPLPPMDSKGVTAITGYETPTGVAVNDSGDLYVCDMGAETLREVAPDGVIENLAGSGLAGNGDGKGSIATFNGPAGVAVDANGIIYIADSLNNTIRKVQMP